ncbi:MAG TPA: four helix bundle protein [Lacunisphaera sp.]|nr:four helix bundle protein [Lacunisphaera sp.]
MDPAAFIARTKAYSLRIIRLIDSLPRDDISRTLGHQLLRAGCSVSANYRAVSRAKSRADFIAKLGIVEEECDETIHWLELLVDSGRVKSSKVALLKQEGVEILSMVVASIRTAKSRR